ncbi:hypothetical protein C814_00605 [Anaerotruncus sp. G3(2012)]|uniref:lysylphosphatidylglycerol synthase domain-containing protein n=1 Tax=Anaerotruncus sp. G3(2012) TaxID=1235835 RepID=UPI00033827BC|nr:lysylphosphatidylglycerol synthase domain-containing protein [Anaerotruncus sp. G3(2012)]EOS64032.1 hypothetical protein C814_00605 [Anaerotruncus sp. G3(2012)]
MKRRIYNIINSFVLGITAIWFIYRFYDIQGIFVKSTPISVVSIMGTALLIYGIKFCRLYLALYDAQLGLEICLTTYCKVTPISIILPFKVGEFFRIYCYGRQIGSLLKSVVIILLDRFMDTAALVTAIALVWIFYGERPSVFIYFLLIFLILSVCFYFVFPGIYRFWTRYLLCAKASEHKIWALKTLESIHTLYSEIENVVKGRGMILYFLSLAAWGIEISNITLINYMTGGNHTGVVISEYLLSAMSRRQSPEFDQFVFISVIGFVLLFWMLWVRKMLFKKEDVK